MNKDYWLDYIEKDPKYPKRALILDMRDMFEKEKLELEEMLKESELKLVQANSVIANLNDRYKLLEKQYDTLDDAYSEIQVRSSRLVLRNVVLRGENLDYIEKLQELEDEIKTLKEGLNEN